MCKVYTIVCDTFGKFGVIDQSVPGKQLRARQTERCRNVMRTEQTLWDKLSNLEDLQLFLFLLVLLKKR